MKNKLDKIARMIGVPREIGLLIPQGLRVKLVLIVLGLVAVSGLDMLGVLLMIPLMGIFTGADRTSGPLGIASGVLGGDASDVDLTLLVSAAAIGAFVVKGLSTIVFRWWQLGVMARQQADTSVQLLRGYLQAPYGMHLNRGSAELMRAMSASVGMAYGSAINGALAFTSELIAVLAVGTVLIVLNPILALCAVVYMAFTAGLIQLLIKPRVLRLGLQTTEYAERSYRSVLHSLGAVKEVKLRNNPDPFVEAYRSARFGEARANREFGFLNEVPKYLMEIVFLVGIALLAVGLFSFTSPENALPVMALFGAAGFRILPSMVRMIASMSSIRYGRSGLYQTVAEVVELRDLGVWREAPSVSKDANQPRMLGDLRVEGLSFGYEPGKTVLTDLDFVVPRGSSVALVGSSGAGKSTLIDLILGLQVPTDGRIMCGEIDINSRLSDWQQEIAIVPQDVFLMDASLRQNIAFDVPEDQIDELKLKEAVAKAELTELATSTPEGLDLRVGDRGIRLSGGQRQRIGIARALYRSPEVMILDEATSALDNETERKITETIQSLQGQMTIIVIAHRLTTVRDCDQFVILSDGRIQAKGTFDEAFEESPEFAHLVKLASLQLENQEFARGA